MWLSLSLSLTHLLTLSLAARPLTLTQIITVTVVSALIAVAIIFAASTCAVRSRAYRTEARQPLLGNQYQRYENHNKTQSVV